MRANRLVICYLFLLSISAFALDLKVRVVDPSSLAVSGARVAVYAENSRQALALVESDARGVAAFHNLNAAGTRGELRIEVLAPGFAPLTIAAKDSGEVTARLKLAPQAETVVVTAAPSPVEAGLTGLNVSTLDATTLVTLQPIAASDAIRFLPGVVLGDSGNRGGQTSLFVRGGDSDYNKVLVDGVPVADPGGYFDFGTTSMTGVDRLEFMRGSESVLYGSDAMSSVLQINSSIGRTRVPELSFGSDEGNFETAHGFASLAGARGRYDYNLFGDQFHSGGMGANDSYDNATQGANLGLQIAPNESLRLRVRHDDSRTGVPGETTFLGQQLLAPATDAWARQNNLLASLQFDLAAPAKWQHQLTVYNYNHQRHDIDTGGDAWRTTPAYGLIDIPYSDVADLNHFGVRYSGEYWEAKGARSNFGYEFEDENGFVGDTTAPPLSHGLRLNHAVYGEQFVQIGRLTGIVGARFVHNESFGNRVVPRASLTYLLSRGNRLLTGTRLKGSYSEGIKEPSFEQSFGLTGYGIFPNPNLKAEQARSLEAGVEQKFGTRVEATATYFNTLFRNQITTNGDFSQYINLNKALAHGAELDLSGRINQFFQLQGSYVYTSTQILSAPLSVSPEATGEPLLLRPKHAATLLLAYHKARYGATLGGSFIGRRPDSDFFGYGYTHAAGYVRVDAGGWYQLEHHVTLYANVENLLDQHYEEVLGYPALTANFRAGVRYRFGGE
jgi:outer membrane cobalamin receptor